MNTALESKLSEYNFWVALDTSGSMDEPERSNKPEGRTRWQAIQETLGTFVRDIIKIDTDGIGLVTFGNGKAVPYNNVTPDNFSKIFKTSPRGSTPMALGLSSLVEIAKASGGGKKNFFTIFTDGVPDDKEAVEAVIRKVADAQQTDDENTFLFIQVGDNVDAAAYLKKLDDNLGTKFDIVDTKTQEEADAFATTAELIAHAITD